MFNPRAVCLLLILLLAAALPAVGEESVETLIESAQDAVRADDLPAALNAVDRAIELDPESIPALVMRARIHEAQQHFDKAAGDYSALLALAAIKNSPANLAQVHHMRGGAYFCAAKIDESIADFDRAIELEPRREPGDWQRGISYYYAGRFREGARQFEGYQKVDNHDVENAVWRFICQAKVDGIATAREQMLPIDGDPRVPLMTFYDLFLGKAEPDDVLQAAKAGQASPLEMKNRMFFAELYLGLWDEVNDRPAEAKQHLEQAAQSGEGGYMGQVAKVDLQLRAAAATK